MNLSLAGKTYVVMGVANKRSIAWGIARSLNSAGARLIFTYAGERLKAMFVNLQSHWKQKAHLFYLVMSQVMKMLRSALLQLKKQ